MRATIPRHQYQIEILPAGEHGPRRLDASTTMHIKGIPFLTLSEFVRDKLKAWSMQVFIYVLCLPKLIRLPQTRRRPRRKRYRLYSLSILEQTRHQPCSRTRHESVCHLPSNSCSFMGSPQAKVWHVTAFPSRSARGFGLPMGLPVASRIESVVPI